MSRVITMKKVIIKISGELFTTTDKHAYVNKELIAHFIDQIKTLQKTHHLGIVIGGGNFFRGNQAGKELGLRQPVADNVGMLATVMNGIILHELFEKSGVPSRILSAVTLPTIAQPINQDTIDTSLHAGKCLIFVGGTSNPYFTTDTNAVVRGLQMGAQELWKATKVDGVYTDDPVINKNAEFLRNTTYATVLEKKLKIMDLTAITLAQEHNVIMRVFNMSTHNALVTVAQNHEFGSTIR